MPAQAEIDAVVSAPLAVQRCRAKVYHPDKKAAWTGINYLLRRHLQHGQAPGLRAYHCQVCGGWHLTKSGAGKTDKRRDTVIRRLERRFEVREYVRYIAARRSSEDMHQIDLAA